MTFERSLLELGFEVLQLSLGTAALEAPAFQRRHARGIIAAVFEPFERINQLLRNRPVPENPDNAAHADQYPHIVEN
jgi:hypothetical protein